MSNHDETPEPEPTQPADVDVDELPEVKAAEQAIRRAREELEKACSAYRNVRQEAVRQVGRLRESTVGEVFDTTLKMVRKHPAAGISLAALIGFFMGRLFRR